MCLASPLEVRASPADKSPSPLTPALPSPLPPSSWKPHTHTHPHTHKQEISVAPPTTTSSSEDSDVTAGQTADEYLAFVEREAKHKPAAAHH